MPDIPSIQVFVRHSNACKYRDDESWPRCNCRKHLRWWDGTRQLKRSAKTRSWKSAEEERRKLEMQFREGAKPTQITKDERKTIARAIELFLLEKRTSGKVTGGVLKKYERELGRFKGFLEARSHFFPADVTKELLIEYRATWAEDYPSTQTQQRVQARLRSFLRFCHDSGWLERLPKLSPIVVDEPPTLPLSKKEYTKLLETVPKVFAAEDKARRVRALIQLMRHSGLAIRDAVTLERAEIIHDGKKKLHRVATARTKTGTPVSVPLPPDVASEVLAVLNGNLRYVFWSGNGLETSVVTNWQHDLRALFREAFGKNTQFTPHCLRDTAAVEWLSAGIPIEEVSKLLGHSSVKTTEKSYAPWVTARQDRLDSLVVATWKDSVYV